MISTVLAFLIGISAQAFEVPKLKNAVSDHAGLLSQYEGDRLETLLRKIQASGGPQIAVLIVPNLGGVTIEQASIQVTDQWKLGDEKKDDGVLILVSQEERAVRIEVGQGLEGNLTDLQSKRIIDQILIPSFRSGKFGDGLLRAVSVIAQTTHPEVFKADGSENWQEAPQKRRIPIQPIIIVLFILIQILGFMFRGRFGRRVYGTGYRHRGHWHGGFGGGMGGGFGGFGGGGGGFSGGGASGRW